MAEVREVMLPPVALKKDLRKPQGAIHIPALRSPGFLVETGVFDDLLAALFEESRTRGRR
jgi:hypothetical protein